MELFIQIQNGVPFEHPIMGDNFRAAFPHIDVNNLPSEFAKFERVAEPQDTLDFQVAEVSYQWVNGVVKDVWSTRAMTEQERATKIERIRTVVLERWEMFKEITQKAIDGATDPTARQMWVDHLAELNAWVLEDPLLPRFPKPPVFSSDGNIYTVNDSGSTPNVID